jgi:hypothetical protein
VVTLIALIFDLIRAVSITFGVMTLVWALAQGWDWLCGHRTPEYDDDA